MSAPSPLQQPVTRLSGIGAQTAARLAKLGILQLQDLLFHLPLRYQDRSRIVPIAELQAGDSVLICGRVEYTDAIQRGRPSVLCRIGDGSGYIMLRFFHFAAHQAQQLKPGVLIGCYGEVRFGYNGSLEMMHPEYRVVQTPQQLIDQARIPIYPAGEGVSQRVLRQAVQQALQLCEHDAAWAEEWVAPQWLRQQQWPGVYEALNILHRPPPQIALQQISDGSHPALQRLATEEFLAHHLALRLGKQQQQRWRAPVLTVNAQLKQNFLHRLPFTLTGAQQRVIAEIEQDCAQAQPMLRLVQGDVGSGKTVVAALTALLAVQAGYQVALMAPTELLAEQHYRNFQHWFADGQYALYYLSGQLKGKARQQTLQAMADGSAQIVIGTHALFQDGVQFQRLGLMMIDEQHRFGVEQRLALREKGRQGDMRPHQLMLTATPIPRTQAMLHYADLDLSVIDELPPGRKPITTRVISGERRQEVMQRISDWVAGGRQAYWVCTLIETSELLQCEAAEQTAVTLREALPQLRIGLVHGRLKAADKEREMQAFKQGELDLLVATTVIEVGVDVPNAGLMIIENAERLGLSQLHQLRGRVGRGHQESYCLLLYQAPLSAVGKERLAIIKQYQDGFVIAEQDLRLRGPGEILGSRQTGQIQFKIADLSRDQHLIEHVPPLADWLLRHRPHLVQLLIERWIGQPRHNMQDMA
jgi:ATP-dependent DNA helicase RecG